MKKTKKTKEISANLKSKILLRDILIFVIIFAIVAGVSFYVGRTYFETWPILGTSMEPTIHNGDRVLLVKKSDYDYDDIIIFKVDDSVNSEDAFSGRYLIKRVIGKEGDTIEIKKDETSTYHVYRNGEIVDESHINGAMVNYSEMPPTVVPEGKIYFLGDNRNVSHDSHVSNHFYASTENIVGKVILRYTSIQDMDFFLF